MKDDKMNELEDRVLALTNSTRSYVRSLNARVVELEGLRSAGKLQDAAARRYFDVRPTRTLLSWEGCWEDVVIIVAGVALMLWFLW